MSDFLEDFPTKEEQAILKLICENSLKAFIKIMHYYTTGAHFTFKPFHNEVIEQLEKRAKYETTKNLLLNLPVGFGKSIIVEYFIAWTFARNKNICHLYTSYSDKLIVKLSSEVMDMMNSEPYAAMWGYTFKKDKKSKANWSIEGSIGRAGLTAGSMGGTITGLDAGNRAVQGFCGSLIIDDAMKSGDEIYESRRDLLIEYYDKKLTTRLRRSDVPTIIIMQRLHEEDLSGYIMKQGKYGRDLTPEQQEKWKEKWDVVTVKAFVDGKSIWEETVSTEMLIEERDSKPWVFYPQRQQEPDTVINTHFKGLNFTKDSSLLRDGICHVDKSFGGKDSTAFAVGKKIVLGDKQKIIIFGKKWRKHVDECISEMYMWRDKFMAGTIYTEDNDDKGYVAKNNRGFRTYHEVQNKHNKIMTYLYSNWKDVIFLEGTDEEYIKEIQCYNENATHDDCPDNAASLISKLLQRPSVEFI